MGGGGRPVIGYSYFHMQLDLDFIILIGFNFQILFTREKRMI